MSNCLIERLNETADNNNLPKFDKYAGIITSYIIDQRHASEDPVTYKDPSEIVIKDIPSKDATETVKVDGEEVKLDVVARIKDLSDLYSGEWGGGGPFMVTKLDRNDKKKQADGTNEFHQEGGGIFLKLPQFWWRCKRLALNGTKYRIDFTLDENIVDEYVISDAPWHEWDGDTFIGVYQSYFNDTHHVLGCESGETPYGQFTFADARYNAHNAGGSYSLITYETYKIIYLLALAWYKTPKFMEMLGEGTNATEPVPLTGLCDSLGMNDTVTGENIFTWEDSGETKSAHVTNFWGLENFFGGPYSEWIEDIVTGVGGTVNIMNDNGEIERTMNVGAFTEPDGTITKLLLGENADIMPAEWAVEEDKGFGYGDIASTSGKRFRTVAGSPYPNLLCTEAADYSGDTFGARIQWHGPWQEY